MKKGYYDLLLNLTTKIKDDYLVKTLQQEVKKIPHLDQYLTQQFDQKLIKELAKIKNVDEKIQFLNQLSANFSEPQFSNNVLLQISEENQKPYQSPIRLTDNYFFTNSQEQSLIEQLNQEIITSDEVDLIYPFISKAMINKLRPGLNYAVENQIPINLITTTFDDQALYINLFELEQLIKNYSNITIRIEDNTELRSERIHIKAAIFHRESGFGSAILGSSNLTMPGMASGREWNIRINQFANQDLYEKVIQEYQKIWTDQLLDFNNEMVRKDLFQRIINQQKITEEFFQFKYSLYDFQKEILKTLTYRREINKHQHLIVMATGTGKTVVSAFDYLHQIKNKQGQKPRILFLAHQKEIIEQGLQTFRQVLNEPQFGSLLHVDEQNFNASYLFATIQSVHRHLKKFQPQQFDLIIFDEAHHIAAKTFDQVFNYFHPQEIIGLTATPEREDNKSILPYFNDEFAYEMRLWDAIDQKLLAKFDYYCIDDVESNLIGIDLNNDQQVFKVLNNESRNTLLLKMIKNYIGIYHQPVALVFCINVEHAQIISDYLNHQGLKANYLTSKNNHHRKQILQDFKKQKINYLCVVNMFNEGIDVPEIDTIILLRPTNSKTVFLQQLGRGLRKTNQKNKLAVYDLIANIDQKYDITVGIKSLYHNQATLNHKEILTQGFALPDGCTISLENRSREIILKNLQAWYQVRRRMHQVIHEYYLKYQTEGLGKIIADYDLSLSLFYQYLDDFYLKVAWRFQNPKLNHDFENQTQRNKNILKQFLFLNNYHLVKYFYLRLQNDLTKVKIDPTSDNLLIISLFPEVTSLRVFDSCFANYDDDLVANFIKNHRLIVEELLMILKYKLEHEVLQVNQSLIPDYPLLIKGTTYTVRQALTAIKRLNFLKQLGELKVIAFQAGFVTFDQTKSVVLADVDGQKYGKLTNYDWEKQEFYWSIPENKNENSKLVRDLQTQDITKFLFLDNKINKSYSNLSLKLYDFVGIGNYLTTINAQYLTVKFKVQDQI